jgi:hypothetical protein
VVVKELKEQEANDNVIVVCLSRVPQPSQLWIGRRQVLDSRKTGVPLAIENGPQCIAPLLWMMSAGPPDSV